VDHHRAEHISVVDQRLGFLECDATPLPKAKQEAVYDELVRIALSN